MKTHKFWLTGLIWFCLLGESFAQITYVGNYHLPPSPDGVALIRSVNTPVNLYSGTLNIQLPLYTVGESEYVVPVHLNCQASGIRVEDLATPVGLGWRLSAGGKITRIVRHYPDETGFAASQGSQASELASWNSSNFEARLKDMDTEPDLFYFEIPGHTGMFVVGSDRQVCLVPWQPLDVQWVDQSYFIITDENGVRYTLGETSASREETQTTVKDVDFNKTLTFVSTWNLDRIQLPNGRRINFTYTVGTDYEFIQYNQKRVVDNFGVLDNPQNFSLKVNTIVDMNTRVKICSPKYLQRMAWSGGHLVFKYSAGRSDLSGAYRLDAIEVWNLSDTLLKTLEFQYGIFGNRAFQLTAIGERSGENYLKLNTFKYYTEHLQPLRSSLAYDHWGFYNGANNKVGYPALTVTGKQLAGDDRSPVLEYARANTIKSITYATGGSKTFEYELNATSSGSRFGGLRIAKIREKLSEADTGLTTSYRYTDLQGRACGIAFATSQEYAYVVSAAQVSKKGYTYNLFGIAQHSQPLNAQADMNGVIVAYPSVVEVHPDGGYVFYEFDTFRDEPDEAHRTYDVIARRYADFQNLHTPSTSRCWQRGRLRKKTAYDAQGNEVEIQRFGYAPKAVKAEIRAFVPYYSGAGMALGNGVDLRIPMIGEYKWISQPVAVDTIVTWGKDRAETTEICRYDPDRMLPVENVVSHPASGLTLRTTVRYPFHYRPDNAIADSVTAYAVRCMNRDHILALPLETVLYRNGNVVDATIQEYRTITANGRKECVVAAQTRRLFANAPLSYYVSYAIGTSGRVTVDPNFRIVSYADEYDNYGNLISSHAADGHSEGVVYENGGTLPVARVENAVVSTRVRRNEVFYTGFEDRADAVFLPTAKSGCKAFKNVYNIFLLNFKPGTYRLAYWKSNNGVHWEKVSQDLTVTTSSAIHSVGSADYYIDELSVLPEHARITTCVYLPGVGKISETDCNGQTLHYEYDAFGRVSRISDNERKPIREYEYWIINE